MFSGSVAHWLLDAFSIVVIDLLLAGDNALVIAMAVRSLPKAQRRMGIVCGAALAVVLRIAITVAAAKLLDIPLLKVAGGVLVVWIAVKVLTDAESEGTAAPAPRRLMQAIWYIVVADITMSLDNILAVAGASRGSTGLIVFGLCLSIPLVVFSSNLLSVLMDRYPLTVYIGAAILGKVGAEMIATDPFVIERLNPSAPLRWAAEATLAVAVIIAGRLLSAARRPA